MINNKARHNLMDAKCRWRSNRLDGAVSFMKPHGQTKVKRIHKGPTGEDTKPPRDDNP